MALIDEVSSQEVELVGASHKGSLGEEPDAVKVARPVLKRRRGRRLPRRP